jgi:3-phosphoshikimate 1-carboxyvinyltransferase
MKTKESDRLAVLAEGIRALGGDARQSGADFTIIPPASPKGARLDPHGDHRMAMAFALMGLRAEGTTLLNPGCVAKSFPAFFETLETLLGAKRRK